MDIMKGDWPGNINPSDVNICCTSQRCIVKVNTIYLVICDTYPQVNILNDFQSS